jgi:protein-disulfide isomerase
MVRQSQAVLGSHVGRFRHGVYRQGGSRGAGLAGLTLTFLALAFSPARAESFSAGQKAEIETIIKDYLLQKPEILREAMGVLEAREAAAEAKAREKVVSDSSGALFAAANQAVIGDPRGKITLIEFFDYNCGYCKRALSDLTRLMKDNPDLRVVLRDFPILSPNSVEAAEIANAFLRQFQGEKFWEFHQKLLRSRGPVGKAEALAVAKDLGADMDKLAKDAAAPGLTSGIEESGKLAKSLQVTGTPTFVIGKEVVVGAVGYDALQAKVANMKKCGKAICS